MKTFVYAIAALLVMTVVQTQPADAASCAQKGRSMASSMGGKFLSARASGSTCKIVILVKSGNGPPRRRTFTVRR
ncbi:MAG: hypothetical protein AAFU56_02470 [Pseudomonadota bacterium]